MDWHGWIEQRIPSTAVQRGGATVWPAGGRGLIGDSLGPVMHLHDDASEVFYFVGGRCRLEIGDSEEFFSAGEFVLVPPEVPHNLWNAGSDDLLVFWIVAPNFVANKWRTEPFPAEAMRRRAIRGRVSPEGELPGDRNIRARQLALRDHASHTSRTGEGQEAILYVMNGQASVSVGKREGQLGRNEFIHVPVGTAYSFAPAEEAATVLLFEMPAK